MTLRAVLAAQGNLKGQGMARRPMPCHFQFSSARQGGVHWLTYELGIQGQVPFPHPTYKALLAINFASRAFSCVVPRRENGTCPCIPVFWFGPLGSFGAIFSGPLSKKREKSAKGKKNSCE